MYMVYLSKRRRVTERDHVGSRHRSEVHLAILLIY